MKYNISFQMYFLKAYLHLEFHWNMNYLGIYFIKMS